MLPGIEQWSNCGNMLLATHNMAKSLPYTGQHCCRQLATLLLATVASDNVTWCMLALTAQYRQTLCVHTHMHTHTHTHTRVHKHTHTDAHTHTHTHTHTQHTH